MTRREILRAGGLGLTGAGAALLFGCGGGGGEAERSPTPAVPSPTLAPGDEPPPEVPKIRLAANYSACQSPIIFAEEYLLEEGFTEVEYVTAVYNYSFLTDQLGAGKVDFAYNFAPPIAFAVDHGSPLVMLGGAHSTCFDIYARPDIQTIGDLRGKTVAVITRDARDGDLAFAASVLQYIGLMPGSDVEVIGVNPPQLYLGAIFDSGKFDATFTYPPLAYSIRDTDQGRVLLDSHTQAPFDQNFCCMAVANRDFYAKYPVASRRALRALLRSVDYAAREPERAAQRMYDAGWVTPLIYAQRMLGMVPYSVWRDYNPEDSVRFYSLHLGEAGLIESTPDEIIEKGTDFTYFNELKEEMAAFPRARNGATALNCEIEARGEDRMARAPVRLRGRTALS
jgi:NitT/TauT family transport system substrate-binding protein